MIEAVAIEAPSASTTDGAGTGEPAPGAMRRRRPPSECTSGESVIFRRIAYGFDVAGKGCYASLDSIRVPRDAEPNDTHYSLAQARRLVRSLQNKKLILYAGSTVQGCNIFLVPGKGKSYDATRIPIHPRRTARWSTDEAWQLLQQPQEPPLPYLMDGYPVSRKIRDRFAPEVIKKAIALIRKTPAYKNEANIQDHARLLGWFCRAVLREERRETARREAQRLRAQQDYREQQAAAQDAVDRLSSARRQLTEDLALASEAEALFSEFRSQYRHPEPPPKDEAAVHTSPAYAGAAPPGAAQAEPASTRARGQPP